MDLGGIHDALQREINFETGEVKVSYVGTLGDQYKKVISEQPKIFERLGLQNQEDWSQVTEVALGFARGGGGFYLDGLDLYGEVTSAPNTGFYASLDQISDYHSQERAEKPDGTYDYTQGVLSDEEGAW